MRPLWLCRVCAAPWSCQPARLLLLMEYRRDRVGLSVYLAGQLFEATGDLVRLNPNPAPTPQELFERFLAWTAEARGVVGGTEPGHRARVRDSAREVADRDAELLRRLAE